MTLHLHGLRVFAAVAEQRNFTRAAERLHISQPAVSKMILELERQLDLNLIERGSQPLQLTDAGERLYQHARAIFDSEQTAEAELAALRGLAAGRLQLGASTTIATYLLPTIVGHFHEQYAGIRISMKSANTRRIADLLLDYQLDIALVEGPVEDPRLEMRPWHSDELVIIASPRHPLAGRTALQPADLAGQGFIMREPGSGTRNVTEAALARCGLAVRTELELGSTEAIKEAVAAGLGVAMVSRASIVDQLTLRRLAVLDVPGLQCRRTLHQLIRKGRNPSAAVQAFLPYLYGEKLCLVN